MIESGADIVEIGFPFSDPIADGPIIQEASFISLSHGMTPDKALEIVKDVRKKFFKHAHRRNDLLKYSIKSRIRKIHEKRKTIWN